MDIAEIRKKAKKQGRNEGEQRESAEEVQIKDDAATDTPDSEGTFAGEITGEPVASQDEHLPTVESGDGLEKLFAATDELVLATDDSYAELLDENSDEHARDISQYLAFHLGDEEYALDIRRISEIIKVREFTDIPRAPEFILGIISLRGVVVPVFDLRQRLNLGRSEMLSTSRIVVCQLEDMTVGLLVDSINQVVNLVDSEIEPPPGVLSGLDRDMVFGIGRYQGRMIILLQIVSVLDVDMS